MASGPSGSFKYFGTSQSTPGVATGETESTASTAALPFDVPSPGLRSSIKVTVFPSRCRCKAADTPTMPAPITAIWDEGMTGCFVMVARRMPGSGAARKPLQKPQAGFEVAVDAAPFDLGTVQHVPVEEIAGEPEASEHVISPGCGFQDQER